MIPTSRYSLPARFLYDRKTAELRLCLLRRASVPGKEKELAELIADFKVVDDHEASKEASTEASAAAAASSVPAAEAAAAAEIREALSTCWKYRLLCGEHPVPVHHPTTPEEERILELYAMPRPGERWSEAQRRWEEGTEHLAEEQRRRLGERRGALYDFSYREPLQPGEPEWIRTVRGPSDEELAAVMKQRADWAAQEEAYKAVGQRLAPLFKTLSTSTKADLFRFRKNQTVGDELRKACTAEEVREWEALAEARDNEEIDDDDDCCC
jgi:hypothetical protein